MEILKLNQVIQSNAYYTFFYVRNSITEKLIFRS